jgi:WhiB family redox-sensing transcriptional regulator
MDCVVENCNEPRHGKGLCYKHYSAEYKHDKRSNEETAVRADAFSDAIKLAELAKEAGEIPCQNAPDLYFPDRDVWERTDFLNSDSTQNYAILKDMCNTICPIRNQCLEFAIKHNERHGIWGGMSYTERRALKRSVKQTVYKAA